MNKSKKEITNKKPYYHIDWSDPKIMESIIKSSLEFIPSNTNKINLKEK